MAKGKEIGAFSHRSTSTTYLPDPAGAAITQADFEGAADGFGTIGLTATFVGGESRTFSINVMAYPESDDLLTASANGTFESVAANRWKTSAVVHVSDGSTVLSEGELNLATRTSCGRNYAWA